MPNFFSRRDPWGNTPALWIVTFMIFLVPLGWWSLKQTKLENDVEHWLPSNDPQLQVLERARTLFPSEERIFVSWEGSSLGDPRLPELTRRFEGVVDQHGVKRNGLKEVANVIEPSDALLLMQQGEVEPQEAARRLQGVLIGAGPLKIRLTEAGKMRLRKTRLEMQDAVNKSLGIKVNTLSAMEKLETLTAIPQPKGEDAEVAPDPAAPAVMGADGKLMPLAALDHDLQLVWNGMTPGSEQTEEVVSILKGLRGNGDAANSEGAPLVDECFFVLGAPVALAVSLSDIGLADKSQALTAIRKAAVEAGISPESLRLGGSAVATTALNQKVTEAAWNPAAPLIEIQRRSVILLSALVGAALAFVMVRSARLAVLILAVSLYATFLSVAIVPVTGGNMNMVLAVMPTLLLVITLSGAVHVANYWKHAAARHPATAISETWRTALFPCALASITTAIGLISLCTSSLSPVRDFGLYGAIGTIISLIVILYGLPSLLQLWPAAPPRQEELDHRGWRELGRMLTKRPSLQAGLFLLVCLGCSWGLKNFRTETKVIRYFPESAGIVRDYHSLENELAGIVPVEVLIRFDAAAQEEVNFLERMELVRNVEENLRSHPEITGCLALADFQSVTEKPAEDAGMLAQGRFKKRAVLMQQRIRDDEIPGTNVFYKQIPESESAQAAEKSLGAPGEEIWRITAQVHLMSDADYGVILADMDRLVQDVLRFQPGSQHVVTGAVPLFLQTQQAVLKSLIRSFGLAFALVLTIFVVFLRNFWAGLVAMIPNVIPITVVFGVLGWCGQRVDIGVMITASIALGIAVDGTLHFLSWYRQALAEGVSRPAAISRALAHCGPAMWQTSVVVAIGLLMLMPADLLLISRFGWLMAAMVGVALLGDIILLPQLLASPLGSLFSPTPPPRANRPSGLDIGQESLPAPHLSTAGLATSMHSQP